MSLVVSLAGGYQPLAGVELFLEIPEEKNSKYLSNYKQQEYNYDKHIIWKYSFQSIADFPHMFVYSFANGFFCSRFCF